jgi:predicted deacylase
VSARDYAEWLEQIDEEADLAGLERSVYGIVEGARGAYPLVRYRTRSAAPGERRLLVTAGFHGDERAGPETLAAPALLFAQRMSASSRGVALDVFPCVNPTGFEAGTRYNRRGERPNNDCLRYEMPDGSLAGELPSPGTPFRAWRPRDGGPEETRALVAALMESPAHDAALDLHEDPSVAGAGTYAYILGPREPLRVVQRAAGIALPVLRDAAVYGARTDADGLIEAHDGSVTDLAFRRGARVAVCVETTTDSPAPQSRLVQVLWLGAMIGLAAGEAPDLEALERFARSLE